MVFLSHLVSEPRYSLCDIDANLGDEAKRLVEENLIDQVMLMLSSRIGPKIKGPLSNLSRRISTINDSLSS